MRAEFGVNKMLVKIACSVVGCGILRDRLKILNMQKVCTAVQTFCFCDVMESRCTLHCAACDSAELPMLAQTSEQRAVQTFCSALQNVQRTASDLVQARRART